MKEFYCFCVFFSVYYTEEGDYFDSLRVSPLAIKFCTKTKRTTFLGRVCHWIKKKKKKKKETVSL